MEKLAGALLTGIPDNLRRDAAKSLFTQVVVNTLLRNGDAHLKNFAILYDSPAMARLSKVFDITTTAAYPPLFGKDLQAMMLNGTKNWPSQKDLIRFGRERCMLEERDCWEIMEKAIRAVTAVGKTMPEQIAKYPGSEHVLGAMLSQWNGAIKSLRAAKPKEAATIKTALDETEQALRDRYGDPYLNQTDRNDRLGKISGPQRTVMHPLTL